MIGLFLCRKPHHTIPGIYCDLPRHSNSTHSCQEWWGLSWVDDGSPRRNGAVFSALMSTPIDEAMEEL